MSLIKVIHEIFGVERNWKWRYGRFVIGLVVWLGINTVQYFVYPIKYYYYPIPIIMIVILIYASITDRGDWKKVSTEPRGFFVFYSFLLFLFLLLIISLIVDILLNIFLHQTMGNIPFVERSVWIISATPFVIYAMRRSKYFVDSVSPHNKCEF
ncbi:hypothetical protein KAX97_12900 [candidate division WOR-3 bacterium]|nr:hypothetical protein [candidate division WOR-3 bacterium]